MKLFDLYRDTVILLPEGACEAVVLAARDLQRDLRRLSGHERGFEICTGGERRGAIAVETVGKGEREAYTVSVTEDGVLIRGSDVLGTVFGIYAFSTKCLGVLPVHRMVDRFPQVRETMTLPACAFSSAERPVRFRGWFINDEDLLTEFRISGGHRDIDYPFYADVVDVEVLDMVLETALRLEINLIIPASFVDICNPDEEKLVRAVTRRGLYISQHHVEPVGVSYFGADAYLKAHGAEEETVSFIGNRARMEEIWHHYIEKWAQYGEQVVWQLGLRGKADRAVWQNDPSVPLSMEGRGGIITDAIATQHRIICETLGTGDFYSTATLWNEGSELYGKGYLQLPKGTVPVFADFGLDQMLGDDFYTTVREPDRRYGIYYHAGYCTLGPHLTEGCSPMKMAYNYRAAAERDSLYYSILNISNVRPLHIFAMMNARMMCCPQTFDAEEELARLDGELFGKAGAAVNVLRRGYYDSFADFGEEPLRYMAKSICFYYRDYGDLSFIRNPATDGQLTFFCKNLLSGKEYRKTALPTKETLAVLRHSAARFGELYRKACEIEQTIPEEARLYFTQFLKYQIRHMQLLTEWCVGCMGLMDRELPTSERVLQGEAACACLTKLLEERRVLEMGQWEHWHRGDKKINVPGLLRQTREICMKLREE